MHQESMSGSIGGLHTGTGVAQDPCYHQACDTYNNSNPTTLTINAKAAAHVLATLATEGHEIIPKGNGTSPGNSTAALRPRNIGAISEDEMFSWTTIEGERHFACGGEV